MMMRENRENQMRKEGFVFGVDRVVGQNGQSSNW